VLEEGTGAGNRTLPYLVTRSGGDWGGGTQSYAERGGSKPKADYLHSVRHCDTSHSHREGLSGVAYRGSGK